MLMDLKFAFKCACGWASHPVSLSKMSLYRRTMEPSYRQIKVMNWTSEAFGSC